MQILVPVGDLVSAGGAPAAFFGLVMPRHPEIEFLWPSRGPDLRLRRLGLLPPNAEPFAVDRSSELRQIAATFAADETELPFAEWVAAAAAALQGIVLQAVDVPSLLPVAHLIRPVFGAMGVGVRRVVECWMGSASESSRHAWPEPEGERIDRLEAMEGRSAAAAELRYNIVAAAPFSADGPAITLSLTSLFSPASPAAPPGRMNTRRLTFIGLPDREGGLDRFIRLASACSMPVVLDCDLRDSHCLDVSLRSVASAEARRRGVDLRFEPKEANTCGLAPAPTTRFDPAPLQALLEGRPVALSSRSWTAAVLDAAGMAALAPLRLESLRSDDELAAVLDHMLTTADAAASELREDLRSRRWDPPDVKLATVYGEAPSRRRTWERVELAPDLFLAALSPAHPRRAAPLAPSVTVVVIADDTTVSGLSTTLASIARQREAMLELIVIDDGSTLPAAVRTAVEAAGSFASLVRQGRAGLAVAMNRGMSEAGAPIICFLRAGSMATADLLAEVAAPLRVSVDVGAVVPRWADIEQGWPGTEVAPPPLTRLSAPVAAAAWSGPGLTVRRSAALGVGGFDTTVGRWTCLDLLLRLQEQGDSVVALDRPARAFHTLPAPPVLGEDAALLRVLSKGRNNNAILRRHKRV